MKRLLAVIIAMVLALSLLAPGTSVGAATQPASCAEIKAANPAAADGEYTIYTGGKVLNVYCYGMSSTPREYLSLPKNGGSYNKSHFLSNHGSITTWFTKLRINPANLTADTEDYTFATSSIVNGSIIPVWYPAGHMPYASGSGCDGRIGEGNIDLTGTPFAVARASMNLFGGWFGMDWSSNDQVARPWGGGWCGNAVPATRWVQLNWLGPSITAALSPAANAAGWHKTDVNVSFTCSAGTWGTPECSPGTTVSAEGAGQQTTGYAIDSAGWRVYAAATVNIDKTGPTASASLSGPVGAGGRYVGPVTVNIAAADNPGGSGVATTYYSVDGGAPVAGTSVVVSQDGSHSVSYYSTDVAGNTGATSQVQFDILSFMPTPPPAVSYRMQFNGLNNGAYVEVPDHPDLQFTTALTLEGWVTWNGTNGYRVFLSKPWTASYTGYHLVVYDGKPMLQIKVADEHRPAISPVALPANQWTHIAATYDGRWSRLYMNGAEVAAQDYGTVKALPSSAGTSLLLGREFTTPGFLTDRTFGGALDNIRVWNTALSPATIAAWQGQTDVAGHPNLVNLRGFWRFDEGSGSTTADSSGRGHAGVLNGATWSGLTINVPAEVTAVATGPHGAAVTYAVSAVDPVDGVPTLSCNPASGSVFPTGTATVTCSATDRPGNTFTRSFPVTVYDNTPPTTTATVSPSANAFGWHQGTATVALSATDVGTGVKKITYSATGAGAIPETSVAGNSASLSVPAEGTTTLSYRASDNVNNVETPQSLEVRIDKTAPIISGAATTQPNAAGWYKGDVTIHWTVSDSLSGIDAAPADSAISGEGNNLGANASVSDKAGNSATGSVSGIKIDRTNPVITATRTPANAVGWNNDAVTITFTCTDSLSGVASCPAPVTLSLQGADQSVTGTVVDNAGNSASLTVSAVNIDVTAPLITASRTPAANGFGWNNSDVTVSFSCTDDLSGVASCSSPVTLSGEGADQSVTGTAVDKAGNSAGATLGAISIDKTAPVISGAAISQPNAAGWYNGNVTIHWTVGDALSGIDAAPADSVITGEGSSLGTNASVSDKAGNSAAAGVSGIKIDRTNPVITATRTPANGGGWNNDAVTITFTCTDSLSGVASCPPPVTLGLQGADQSVAGTVVDNAGNSASLTVSAVNIDLTAPVITASRTPVANGFGWNNSDVTVSFTCTDDLSGVASCSGPTTLSGEGAGQNVTGNVADKAGNSASATLGDVNIDKTQPVVTYSGNAGSYTVDEVVNIACSSSDSLSGVASDNCANITGPAYSFAIGANSYSAMATDKAGNVGNGSTSFTVNNTYDSLCSLGTQFSTNPDVSQGLCDKLAAAKASDAKGNANSKAGQIKAYINLVEAQTGKALTNDQAAILLRLVRLF